MALSKASSLVISYGGTNLAFLADQLGLYRYDDGTGTWVPVNGTNDPAHQRFTGKISLLGRYQLSVNDPGKGGW